jgi:DNA modification methylase
MASEKNTLELNTIHTGDALEILKTLPAESVDVCITSPPYWSLRDYEKEGQIGTETTFENYLDKLIETFDEVKRVLKQTGSCWVNIGDVYASKNMDNIKKQSLIGIPDRFKLKMIEKGWLCRNEIIWHKPNAIPSSAKSRFTTDYEKFYFFTKDDLYHFETQYEEASTPEVKKTATKKQSKYVDDDQEASVRQGMNRSRGEKTIEVRPKLPSQAEFVNYIRSKTAIKTIAEAVKSIQKTKIEHWFRRDIKGFSYPSKEDWAAIKHLFDDGSESFKNMDEALTYVEYETDAIDKNIHKGRLMRTVWSINTKPFKGGHFAPFPPDLVEIPIKSCCPENGVVLDIYMGSGTTGLVAQNLGRNYIGIDLNEEYVKIAQARIDGSKVQS